MRAKPHLKGPEKFVANSITQYPTKIHFMYFSVPVHLLHLQVLYLFARDLHWVAAEYLGLLNPAVGALYAEHADVFDQRSISPPIRLMASKRSPPAVFLVQTLTFRESLVLGVFLFLRVPSFFHCLRRQFSKKKKRLGTKRVFLRAASSSWWGEFGPDLKNPHGVTFVHLIIPLTNTTD